jgi:hypothetical protein
LVPFAVLVDPVICLASLGAAGSVAPPYWWTPGRVRLRRVIRRRALEDFCGGHHDPDPDPDPDHDHAHDPDPDRDPGHAHDPAHDPDHDHDRDRDHAHDPDRDPGHAHDPDLDADHDHRYRRLTERVT